MATVLRFPIFAIVDERAHFSYVQVVAEEGRLPFAAGETIPPEVRAIEEGVYPAAPRQDPATLGIAGQSYEAFQPPLYYSLAAPVFLLAGDHRDAVTAIRAFDLALLLVAVGERRGTRHDATPLAAGDCWTMRAWAVGSRASCDVRTPSARRR